MVTDGLEQQVTPATNAVPLPVFIFAGQSNMLGTRARGKSAEQYRAGRDDILAFDAKQNAWRPLALGVLQKHGHGPEMSFARAIVEKRGGPLGVIKVARDGSSLSKHWFPRNGQPGLYAKLTSQVENAGRLRPVRVVGFLWSQGAGDAKKEGTARSYRDMLEQLVTRVREDFGVDVPVVLTRTQQTKGTRLEERFPFMDVIREAHETVGSGPNCAWFSVDDAEAYPRGPDGAHFSSEGMVQVGVTFAEHVLRLAGEAKPTGGRTAAIEER